MAEDTVDEIKQYFQTEHPSKAKFYNLDGEVNSSFLKSYEFEGKITQEYAFLKKEVTPLSRIQRFCKDLQAWLDADDDNVAVVPSSSEAFQPSRANAGHVLVGEKQNGTDDLLVSCLRVAQRISNGDVWRLLCVKHEEHTGEGSNRVLRENQNERRRSLCLQLPSEICWIFLYQIFCESFDNPAEQGVTLV
eukprot:753656-Hanusia_phi.AAC.17